jgi:hypothetical protein
VGRAGEQEKRRAGEAQRSPPLLLSSTPPLCFPHGSPWAPCFNVPAGCGGGIDAGATENHAFAPPGLSAVPPETSFPRLRTSAVCLESSAVCLRSSAVCLESTAVCLESTAVCLESSGVCLRSSGARLRLPAVEMRRSGAGRRSSHPGVGIAPPRLYPSRAPHRAQALRGRTSRDDGRVPHALHSRSLLARCARGPALRTYRPRGEAGAVVAALGA